MRLPFRSRTNRKRAWWDRIGEKVFGSNRHPLTVAEVKQRAVAVVALILPYVAWNHGQVAVKSLKDFRGRMDAEIADGMRLDGRIEAALSHLMHAQQRTPQLPEIWRAIAWAAAPGFPVQALYYFEKLGVDHKLTPRDSLMMAALHMRLDQPAEAAAIYDALVSAFPTDPDVWRAWGSACLRVGDYSEALKAFQRVRTLLPHDTQAALGLAEIMHRSGKPDRERESVGLLLSQLHRAIGAKLPCARDLAHAVLTFSLHDDPQRTEIASLLGRMEDRGPELELASIFLRHSLHPETNEALQRREQVKSFLAGHRTLDYSTRKKVAGWLKRHGEDGLLLDWISLADAAGDEVLFSFRLESLLASGQWKEVAEMALHPAAGALSEKPEWLQILVSLRTGREDPHMAEMLLRSAVAQARVSGNPVACKALGYASLDYGVFPLAADAFGSAMKAGEDPSSILKEFLHAARRSGQDADSALSILSHHVQSGDKSTDMRKQTTYLRLLCGDQMERAALDLARLKKDLPNDPFVKFLNGFMGYRLGDYTSAVHSLVPMPAHRWQQGETIVIATILASGGKTREAAKLAERITGQGVFPEERRMLEGWKSRTELDPGLLSSVTLQP